MTPLLVMFAQARAQLEFFAKIMNTGWTQEGKIKVLDRARHIICGRNHVTRHDRSAYAELHSDQDGISLKYAGVSRNFLDPPGKRIWRLSELKQRHGESALMMSGNQVGDCVLHDNGEFSIHVPYPNFTPNSILRSCSLGCLACGMTGFLSCCNSVNALHARPEHWLCGVPSTDQESLDKLVDVLICQNSHCGEYHTIRYKYAHEKGVELVVHRANFTLRDMTEKRTHLQTALIHVAMLPPVLSRIILDFLVVTPLPPPNANQRDIDEKVETIHPIEACVCWHAKLWSRPDRPVKFSSEACKSEGDGSFMPRSTYVRDLDILVHGCRESKGKEAKLVYRYNSRPTRQLYGCGPFEVNIVLGLVY